MKDRFDTVRNREYNKEKLQERVAYTLPSST